MWNLFAIVHIRKRKNKYQVTGDRPTDPFSGVIGYTQLLEWDSLNRIVRRGKAHFVVYLPIRASSQFAWVIIRVCIPVNFPLHSNENFAIRTDGGVSHKWGRTDAGM